MLVSEYLDSKSSLRYLIRDVLKTRYSDEQLLVHLNSALKRLATDSRWFKGIFSLQIQIGLPTYELDPRILEVLTAYSNDCTIPIKSIGEECNTEGSKIEYLTYSNHATNGIRVNPTLDTLTENSAEGIVHKYNLESEVIGVALQIQSDGSYTPVVSDITDCEIIVLECVYRPVLLDLNQKLPQDILMISDLLNTCVQMIVTSGSTVSTTKSLHKAAANEYMYLLKQTKKIRKDNFLNSSDAVAYRRPFLSKRKHTNKDF